MTILYKICLYENRLTKHGNRPCSNSLYDIVFTCLISVLKQMKNDDEIIFFCDGNDYVDKLISLCNYYNIKNKILTFDYKNAAKIHYESVLYIKTNQIDELIYVCEDDYLHVDNALNKIKEFLTKYPNYFCHPIDYPNLYENDSRFIYDSKIILSDTHHWRSIKSTTYTLAFTKNLFVKHYNTFKIVKDDVWLEHGINLLYIFNDCYSPIPSLTSHISPDCLPYIINSQNIFDYNLNEFKSISL